ncbi:MAG: amidohydrolase [Alphaproteobacteria bacterium]|nr:amidohydrolase [Alphaproteobacteria bacterium]
MSMSGQPATSTAAPAGGIVFTGCALMGAASASGTSLQTQGHGHAHAQTRRREVVVNGKRIKTVDVHAHCCVPAAMAVIDHPLEAPGLLMADTSVRIAAMDSQGIDVEALSINPFWYGARRDAAAELIRIQNETLLTNTIGNPLETTIALSHLIFEGTLDRFPGLKICAAHGGGFLPSYANRSDAVIRTFPNRVGPLPKKPPTAYLRDGQLFFDTIVFTPEALRHLIAETGPGQIMIGTDYPFPWTSTEVDLVLKTPGLSDDERVAILGGTAARLLGIRP